jgi:hypothetical protein
MQPQHEHPRPPHRLGRGEPARDPANQVIEHTQPPDRVYAMDYGHCTIVMGCRNHDDHAVAVPHPAPPRRKTTISGWST